MATARRGDGDISESAVSMVNAASAMHFTAPAIATDLRAIRRATRRRSAVGMVVFQPPGLLC